MNGFILPGSASTVIRTSLLIVAESSLFWPLYVAESIYCTPTVRVSCCSGSVSSQSVNGAAQHSVCSKQVDSPRSDSLVVVF